LLPLRVYMYMHGCIYIYVIIITLLLLFITILESKKKVEKKVGRLGEAREATPQRFIIKSKI